MAEVCGGLLGMVFLVIPLGVLFPDIIRDWMDAWIERYRAKTEAIRKGTKE